MADAPPVLTEMRGATLLVTLNRPGQRNALDDATRSAMETVVSRARTDPDVRAVVITGAGGNFCAGGDLGGLSADRPVLDSRERVRRLHLWFHELSNLEKPVVAAVDGVAFGAGMSLALCADFVIASESARFCAVFGRVGLIPDLGALYFLPRIVGLQRAKDIVFTARVIGAAEAVQFGIVHEIAGDVAVLDHALAFAARFRDAPTGVLGIAKTILNQSFNLDQRALADIEATAQALVLNSDYHRDALARFRGKVPLRFVWEDFVPGAGRSPAE